jgi:hypothetical protein
MRLTELFENLDNALETASPPKIQWKMPRNSPEYTSVWIDVAKLDHSWKNDKGFYITSGGGGDAIKGRYQRFGDWLQQGLPVEMPEVSINERYQRIQFGNGRHRFRWLVDHGVTRLPVCVPKEQAQEIKKRFGA